ncbi:hypothetical protein O4J56_10655 [Nocardiopsis sp. RSe5-2]|uniref:Translation initiation factor 2 n=1 Tax=Nocardiopsis endophytica TaxID=3018445 RepID=A0ABT4U2C1_9ACTN|nr:hypothetical protein [Nocardiopsis endophytica]MDA2811097.1 hypothetical protein [Nocardiopsis endophytica]
MTRLMDVLPVFESDFRVQVVFTRARTSNFREGVTEYLTDLGAAVAPWEQAVEEEFDLALTASLGDDLHLIKAPVVAVSHGAGYNKLGKPETGNRKPETDPHSHSAPNVFGISRQTLFRNGVLIPSALVLSHEEQRDRVARSCPEALAAAVVAGDPTFDRILAGRRWRDDYRRALGADGRRLVLLTSTWGPSSLLGRRPELIRRVLRELPRDEYRVVLVAHPNAWYGHGMWQMRTWLASCERSGLAVLPPRAGWQAALAAADHVIGDHGSVTFYGAALGTHTMLGAFPHDEVDPDSPVGAFGRSARVLDDAAPIEHQLLDDAAAHEPDRFAPQTSQLTSLPGKSGATLRALFYGLMNLAEPAVPARVTPPDTPEPLALDWPRAARVGPLLVEAEGDTSEVHVRRYPAEMYRAGSGGPERSHLLVDASEPDEAWRDSADVLLRREPTPGARAWAEGTLATETGLRMAAAVEPDGTVVAALIPGRPRTEEQDRPLTVRVRLHDATAGVPAEAGLAALWRADADGCDLWRPVASKLHLGERTADVRIAPAG